MLISDDALASLRNPARQLEALTVLSSQSLRRDDPYRAFLFADRRCRIAAPESHDLLLRSEALRRLGHADAAAQDAARAFELDPTDSLVAQRMLAARGPGAERAARFIVASPRTDADTRDMALDVLFDGGADSVAVLRVESDRLLGWVAWTGGPMDLRIEGAGTAQLVALTPESGGPAGRLRAGVDHILSGEWTGVTLMRQGAVSRPSIVSIRRNPVEQVTEKPAPGAAASADGAVTVVIPVYDDVEVTEACLRSVARQGGGPATVRTIVIDDASPVPDMAATVAGLCTAFGFDLITNDRNLGFIGSVNKALDRIEAGDVLLLNSDVVLPDGAIARLAEAARARPGIGIVNPLTNDGQFNSFPAILEANPFESEARIGAIDRAAATVNFGRMVSIPSGIGFCMYVTRACLDAVGKVPEVYLRGYYEDIEFCLRARDKGFDSVCATDVYVGHKGTRSFKDEKRGLVVRNTRALRSRFPGHDRETRAFLLADPLRTARADLQDLSDPLKTVPVLLAGSRSYRSVLDARARMLHEAGTPCAILTWSAGNGTTIFGLEANGEAPARARSFDAADPEMATDLTGYLAALALDRVEIAGPPGLFGPVLEALSNRGIGCGFLLSESLGRSPTVRQACPNPERPEPCATCIAAFDGQWRPHGIGLSLVRALQNGQGPAPDLIVSMDAMSQEVAIDLANDIFVTSRFQPFEPPAGAAPAPATELAVRRKCMALLAPQPDAAAEAFVAALIAMSRHLALPWDFVILGEALDRSRLMSAGNLFVSGPVDQSEWPQALNHYAVAAVCAPQRWSGYGPLARVAADLRLPKAYFDWSIGAMPATLPDLSLDPRLCDRKAATLMLNWLGDLLAEAPA